MRDIFTASMNDHEIQRELLKVTLSPERALELSIGIELGARSQLAIQAKHLQPTTGTLLTSRQDEVMVISSSQFRGTKRPTPNTTQTSGRATTHNCINCGSPWTIDHKSKCQAMGQICRRCNKANQVNLNRPLKNQRINEILNIELQNTTKSRLR